jgi:hypothetical protein
VHRDDGAGILYPGALHDLHGEPGHGKSWFAFHAGAEALRTGGAFGVLDYEGTPHVFVDRMRALGVDDDVLCDRDRVAYHNLPGKTGRREVEALTVQFIAMEARLVVLDAMLPALVRNGHDDNSNSDLATFYETVTRPLTAGGAAVCCVDHVTRDPSTRTRGARGAGAKLQLVDVSYSVKLTRAFSRTQAGDFKVVCEKDRFGTWSIGETVAVVHVEPHAGGTFLEVDVRTPEQSDPDRPFRPTRIMENISRALEEAGPLATNALRTAAKGDDKVKPLARSLLVNEGYISEKREGQATVYASLKPYRDEQKG